MKRSQQSSILSFFQPRSTAPPSADAPPKNSAKGATSPPPPPPPPPPPSNTLPEQPQQQLSPPEPAAAAAHPPRIPLLPSPPSLPSQASIVPVAEHHIPALRRINSLLLPVAYPDSFYSKALNSFTSGLFSRVILWKDSPSSEDEAKVVGGLICRLEPNPFLDQAPAEQQPTSEPLYAIYIQSLALLSPYRSRGLAAAALEHIVASATILPSAGSTIDVRTLYAHVWTENLDALKWYESRGFVREGHQPLQGYYFKLRPDTAWIMRRDIGPGTAAPSAPRISSTNTTTPSVLSSAINLPSISQPPTPIPAPPPRQLSSTSASSAASSSLSFQNARPETEWNDLPDDMVQKPFAAGTNNPPNNSNSNLLSPTPPPGSNGGSAGPSSSRSSSTARKKRTYPAAAFGQ